MNYNDKKVISEVPKNNAILHIKHLVKNDEDVFFEDMIDSENNLISIDFLNGKTLSESGFSKVNVSSDKYYLEFFDNVDYKNIIDYLENDNSDFRVTCQDGTIIRPSLKDLEYYEYLSVSDEL